MGKLSRRWQIYAILNYLIAFSLLVYLILTAEGKAPLEIIFFALLVFSLEFFSVQIAPLHLYSLSFPFLLASIVLFGPAPASLLALFSTVTLEDLKKKSPWFLLALRASQFVIPTALGGIAFLFLGGETGGFKLVDIFSQVLPFLGAALAFAVAFNVLTAFRLKLEKDEAEFKFISGQQEPLALAYSWSLLVMFGLLIVQVYTISKLTGLVWLVVAFLIVQHTLLSYLESCHKYPSELASFISAIEEKQAVTKEHSQRVADYALRIADQMSIADEQKKELKEAALLHDIGMMSVALRIIGKPGRLTRDEFEPIKSHPEQGATILKKIGVSEDVLRIIRFHHERFDGTGYPEGLIGETIPLLSRILTVADSFEAMVSPRPYRQAMAEKRAIQELKNFSATQFDPAVVDAFANLMVPRLDWEKEITPTLFEEVKLPIEEEL